MSTSKAKTKQEEQIRPHQNQMPQIKQTPYLNKIVQTMRPIFWTK